MKCSLPELEAEEDETCMKRILWIMVLLGALTNSIFGQGQLERYAEIPHEQVLLVVASQPRCPLKIEEASYLMRLDKPDLVQKYKVRNVSDKPIELFTVFAFFITSSGETLPPPQTMWKDNKLLLPGETIDSLAGHSYEIVPLTDDAKAKLGKEQHIYFDKGVQRVFILMIEKALFADGTAYRDVTTSDSLGAYLQRLEFIW